MRLQKQVPLAEFSSYKIGGPARYFIAAKKIDEVRDAVKEARRSKQKIFILGGATNLLIDDSGFRGMILKPDIQTLEIKKQTMHVGAGVLMADAVAKATKAGLSGLEWAGGLPGTVGGAVRGNAGCFGGETKDAIASVVSFDTKNCKLIRRNNSECRFGYRSSIFKEKHGQEIVLEVVYKLIKGNKKKIEASVLEKIQYRRKNHPLEYPNIGSIFKNVPVEHLKKGVVKVDETLLVFKKNNELYEIPVKRDPFPVVPTAYLISEAGLKGVSFGGAMISPKHPNFIVNVLGAKSSDVKCLIALVKKEVKKKFDVELEEEVQLV